MSSVSSTSAATIQTDFLNLLINQLRYQNPLEPMDNNQMASQLAQISQLEQMENQSGFMKELLLAQQRSEASALIGKSIIYLPKDAEEPVQGTVRGVLTEGGEIRLITDANTLTMDQVQAIMTDPA